MFERFTERARYTLAEAQRVARDLKSPAIRRHHLLVALLDAAHEGSGSVAAVLADAGVDPGELRGVLVESIKASESAVADVPKSSPFSQSSKKALELSLREALSLGHNYIGREHLLLGILRDADGPLAEALSGTGLTHRRAREIVADQSPPSRVAAARRRGFRGRLGDFPPVIRGPFARRSTLGLQKVLARAFERAGADRNANTGDLLVALLETPGTHFQAALSSIDLPDTASIAAEVDRLCITAAPDGTEDAIRVDESGAVTINDPDVAAEIKRLVGEGAVTPEAIREILRRLKD